MFVLLCALLAGYSHPADASLDELELFFYPAFCHQNRIGFNVTIGGKLCATQARDVKTIGSSSEAASAATLAATSHNRQQIVLLVGSLQTRCDPQQFLV